MICGLADSISYCFKLRCYRNIAVGHSERINAIDRGDLVTIDPNSLYGIARIGSYGQRDCIIFFGIKRICCYNTADCRTYINAVC